MTNKIEILCPPIKCGKCKRMIAKIEKAVKLSDTEADIKIIDSIDQLQTYSTWVLPSLIINDRIVSRGYVPEIRVIQQHLDQKLYHKGNS